MTTIAAYIATARFGLGARPGEMKTAARDPRGWLVEQLRDDRLPKELANFASSSATLRALAEARKEGKDVANAMRKQQRADYREETAARVRAQIVSRVSFRERLVAFWSNHFTVSVRRPIIAGAVGAFEREAIRPHVTGRFRNLLGAVVGHPVMLLYLDNAQSIGPNSVAGKRRKRGLNENLARELLELHTLGVDAGYDQDDVREMARMLTGWSVAPAGKPRTGAFLFDARLHEPGAKTLLGKRYPESGVNEVEQALDALVVHPATARHIATKMARHFIADEPPLAVVARLANVFLESEGDLGAMTGALINSEEAWAEPLSKVKSPNEFIVSALRGLDIKLKDKHLTNSLGLLAQVPFTAPSPAGWPDTAEDWIGPEALMRRTDWAVSIANNVRNRRPSELLDSMLGPVAATDLRRAVERAPTVADGLALLLASPTFQRR